MSQTEPERRFDTPSRAEIELAQGEAATSRSAFESDAREVLLELRAAFESLLNAAPSPAGSCAEVEAVYGIDAKLAWQVLRISRAQDVFSAGIGVPARSSIDRLLKSAKRRRVPSSVTQRVALAFDRFERLVEEHAGSRSEFELLASAYSPESRERVELARKISLFEGVSGLRGASTETQFGAMFFSPSADGVNIDAAHIDGHIGLKRTRPGDSALCSDGIPSGGRASASGLEIFRTLDGRPVTHGHEAYIPEFCSISVPQTARHLAEGAVYYSATEQDVGLRSAVTLVRGLRENAVVPRYRHQGQHQHISAKLDFPTKRLFFDLYLHEDLFPGQTPELFMYDTAYDGSVKKPFDPERDHRRVQLGGSIQTLGRGLAAASTCNVPRYSEMLEYVRKALSLEVLKFRGFRLDMEYPPYGVQYMFALLRPEAPVAAAHLSA